MMGANDSLLEQFYEVVKTEKSPKTARIYRWHLKWYLDWVGTTDEIENPEKSVTEYLRHKAKEGWNKSTANIALHALAKFWTKVKFKPFTKEFVTLYGCDRSFMPKILTREEVSELFSAAARELVKVEQIMMKTGWYCALRSSELTDLRRDSLLPNNYIRCPVYKSRKEKYKELEIPSSLYKELMSLPPSPRGKLFVNPKTGNVYTAGEWSSLFSKFAERVLGKHIRWHDFARHTRLTHLAEDTRDFFTVLMISGHSNPAVAKKYFQLAKVKLPEVI